MTAGERTGTKRWTVPVVIVAIVVAAGLVVWAVWPSTSNRSATGVAHHTSTASTLARRTVAESGAGEGQQVPPATLIATLHGTVDRYTGPGGTVMGTVPGTWYGRPSVLPVVAQSGGYLEIRLAQRPNGSTGWIRQSDATLTSSQYAIVIDLATKHLALYRAGSRVLDAPAGIGTPQDPTPAGQFFVAFFAAPPSPGYGPFVIVTSGHSNAISDWEMSGDALVAIHGPLGADAAIGTTGAAVSHGCVRLHIPDLESLRDVPAGSPVDIVA